MEQLSRRPVSLLPRCSLHGKPVAKRDFPGAAAGSSFPSHSCQRDTSRRLSPGGGGKGGRTTAPRPAPQPCAQPGAGARRAGPRPHRAPSVPPRPAREGQPAAGKPTPPQRTAPAPSTPSPPATGDRPPPAPCPPAWLAAPARLTKRRRSLCGSGGAGAAPRADTPRHPTAQRAAGGRRGTGTGGDGRLPAAPAAAAAVCCPSVAARG